ncbi:L-tyrosine/L-tryptophan isonitrile synthase family protein [Acinetobacter calcoaceticus]|uniref:L-tyrosine/L-tryptophan isonitrile synthase family protein n=1 Tax=Acinetobacter calcoaceticus TaxID=471 RepID=UPI001E528B3E|nr:L-tyrosine/L-tryptophan isonitrile synthase family protein [Acinetobacter calcoaceticus]UGQ25668.1 isocyanide synthase family protein [Acinetobacter calcoaceticus]
MLNHEQKRSQISSGHRLIQLTKKNRDKLYTNNEFNSKAIFLSADFWLENFIPQLKINMSTNISNRVSATISRARKNISLYNVETIGVPELIAEALFDNNWYKAKEDNISRIEIRDKIEKILSKNKKIELYLPILSRKPYSPVKNKGTLPDISELHTLARCAEAAYTINSLSPTGCEFIILSDGFKYNRACGTPDSEVELYQSGLNYWIDLLDIKDVVKLENYETWVNKDLSTSLRNQREIHYNNKFLELKNNFYNYFDSNRLDKTMSEISSVSDVGAQLEFTFWSIVSSVYYEELFSFFDFNHLNFHEKYYNDDIQKLYTLYLTSLDKNLNIYKFPSLMLNVVGHLSGSQIKEIFKKMRLRAWESAIKYVAISLTDRELNTLEEVNENAIKLTIHGKKGEVHFLSTTKQDANITAQHCCGGIDFKNGSTKLSFKYRIERELKEEIPILIEDLVDSKFNRNKYGNIFLLSRRKQPICYVSNVLDFKKELINSYSIRRD